MEAKRLTTHRAVAATLLAGALCILMGACRGPDPKPSPSPSVVPPTPAPTPPRPTLPENAKDKSSKGARAFANYYYQLIFHARFTGDWAPVKKLSSPSCRQCKDFWATKPSRWLPLKRGLKLTNEDWLRTEVEGRSANVYVGVDALPVYSAWTPGKGDRVIHPIEGWTDLVSLEHRANGWRVAEIEPSKNP